MKFQYDNLSDKVQNTIISWSMTKLELQHRRLVAWMLLQSGSVAPLSKVKAINIASSYMERKITRLLRGAQVIPKTESNFRICDSFKVIYSEVIIIHAWEWVSFLPFSCT